ncbi:unnamed protein product [Closterium sp. Yama58-4]|nr:unnamed protein product [Closterium sp. Yama58-4]
MISTLIYRSGRHGRDSAPAPAATAVRCIIALLLFIIPHVYSIRFEKTQDVIMAPRIRVHNVVPCADRSENMITSNIASSAETAAGSAADAVGGSETGGKSGADDGSDCVIKAHHAGMLRPHPAFVRLHRAAVRKALDAAKRKPKEDPRALPPHRRRVRGAEDLNLRSAEDLNSLVFVPVMADDSSVENRRGSGGSLTFTESEIGAELNSPPAPAAAALSDDRTSGGASAASKA